MKNEQYQLGKPIPDSVRLEVYKEALEKYKEVPCSLDGLCLSLPMVLWGLNNYLDRDPKGERWDYTLTPKSFPELTEEWLVNITKTINEKQAVKLRVKFLKQAIKSLSSPPFR